MNTESESRPHLLTAERPEPERAPVRLLLIDDSPEVHTTLRAMLSPRRVSTRLGPARHYVIDQVEQLETGLEAMRSASHDCYLVDHRVGPESGVNLIRAARQAGIMAPIVMLTGSTGVEGEAAEAGANDFLVKGNFDIPTLERTIRYAINNAEGSRRLSELNATLESQVVERTRQHVEVNARLMEQIAAREKAETALSLADRLGALGRMTGSVAHDFNNVLTALFGSLETLQRRLGGDCDAKLARPLNNALEAARMGERMVEGLLAFARRQPLAPRRLDVSAVVAETESLLRLTLGSGVALDMRLAAGLPEILADRDQLERAALNLASNARDALAGRPDARLEILTEPAGPPPSAMMPQGSVIRPEAQWLRLVVRDNGPGMTAQAMQHAFEPFFSTKEPGHGTGLGLAQVYGFAQQCGGVALLEGAQGEGLAVILLLPSAPVAGEAVASPA